jgi:hypothetical protein
MKVMIAVLTALAVLSAGVAAAGPTGTITVGGWISTGQLTAQFYSTSGHGGRLRRGVVVSVREAGRARRAVHRLVERGQYVGEFMNGPGWQRSALEAFYADPGVLCLWVSADQAYSVATAAAPSKPAPPAPTPPPPAPAAAPVPSRCAGWRCATCAAPTVPRSVLPTPPGTSGR